jgi:Cu(I)/Ag(I) efflux system protein CusF
MKSFLTVVIISASSWLVTMNTYASNDIQNYTDVQKSYASKGEVIAIDKVAVRVKLKHDAIPELNWPAMTMFFSVTNKSQLDDLVVGNKVKFQLVKNSSGMPVITDIKAIK